MKSNTREQVLNIFFFLTGDELTALTATSIGQYRNAETHHLVNVQYFYYWIYANDILMRKKTISI